jgi:hypothetical protein
MKFVYDILGWAILVMPLALALALVVIVLSWAVEAVLRRQIGLCLGYAMMATVAFLTVLTVPFAQFEITDCGLFGMWPGGGCREFASPNCDCEFSPLFQLLGIFFAFVTMPLLIVSQMKLKKWSQSRHA